VRHGEDHASPRLGLSSADAGLGKVGTEGLYEAALRPSRLAGAPAMVRVEPRAGTATTPGSHSPCHHGANRRIEGS
jgi:hypothetical protein